MRGSEKGKPNKSKCLILKIPYKFIKWKKPNKKILSYQMICKIHILKRNGKKQVKNYRFSRFLNIKYLTDPKRQEENTQSIVHEQGILF